MARIRRTHKSALLTRSPYHIHVEPSRQHPHSNVPTTGGGHTRASTKKLGRLDDRAVQHNDTVIMHVPPLRSKDHLSIRYRESGARGRLEAGAHATHLEGNLLLRIERRTVGNVLGQLARADGLVAVLVQLVVNELERLDWDHAVDPLLGS